MDLIQFQKENEKETKNVRFEYLMAVGIMWMWKFRIAKQSRKNSPSMYSLSAHHSLLNDSKQMSQKSFQVDLNIQIHIYRK